MKQTGCWIWDLVLRLGKLLSSTICQVKDSDRPLCSLPLFLKKYKNLQVCEHQTPVKFLITAHFCLADFLEDYLFLTVGRVGGTTTNIEQKVMDVEEFERTNKLIEILTTMGQYCIFVLQ